MFATDYNIEFKKRFAWYDGFCRTCGRNFGKNENIGDAIGKLRRVA